MKDVALALIEGEADPAAKMNLLREYLQSLALRSLHESEAFTNLSFVGGTALRFIFGLPRFSEDLDFSLDHRSGYRGATWMKKLKRDLALGGFDVTVTWNDRSTVHKAWVKIASLLEEAGLAAVSGQKLSIKLEIDTKPPTGAARQRRIITRHASLAVQHHDLPTLMAGKVHALLARTHAKGRDWYDLLWYRGRIPPVEPNTEYLQRALDQTEGRAAKSAREWRDLLLARLARLDCAKLAADVEPFLENQDEALLLTTETIRDAVTPGA